MTRRMESGSGPGRARLGWAPGLVGAMGLLGAGCNSGLDNSPPEKAQPSGFRDSLSPGNRDSDKNRLVDPTVDYPAALRAAAVRLTGNYPTLAEIKQLQKAADPPSAYAQLVDSYLARPAFAAEQVNFWRDSMRLVGQKTVAGQAVALEGAPTFAASLVVGEQPLTNLFTATRGTCPTFNPTTGAFAAADCPGGAAVGVLTDPGMNSQFYSSMAFRRARWTVETFLCQKLPTENGGKPQLRPGGAYSSPWPMSSISGGAGARVDFLDDANLVCANCHTTLNHFAPLLGRFDEAGRLVASGFGVVTPITGNPASVLTDWLPPGEGFAWRYGVPVSDLGGLGRAIAADPGFPACMATRAWNWAFGRGDAVVDQATLSPDMVAGLTDTLVQSNYNMKKLIRQVFTSASFVRF